MLMNTELTNETLMIKKLVAVMGVTVMISSLLIGCSSKTPAYTPLQTTDTNRLTNDPKEVARVRTAIASQFIRDHQLDDAKRQLERVFEADKNYAPAYDMMGVLLQQEGSPINLQKAEGYFKRAIQLDPEFTQAHNNYGVYLSQTKRYGEALQQFEIAGSTLGYEGRSGALENLGRTALKLNQTELATQSFMKALDANRQSVIARIELIDIFIQQGKYQNAQMLYDDVVLLLGNKNTGARVLLQGIQLAKAYGNAAEQQRLIQQLFDLYPTSDEAVRLKKWLNNPGMPWK